MNSSEIKLWHNLTVRDANTMITWLIAVGFQENLVVRDETDERVVLHAELVWPGGGGVMLGSARDDGPVANIGRSSAYLVCADPDVVIGLATGSGGVLVQEPSENDYGGRGGVVADPEGNQWSIGSYQPTGAEA